MSIKVINWEIIFTNNAEITKYSYGKINLIKSLNKVFSMDKRKEGTDCRTIKEIESI